MRQIFRAHISTLIQYALRHYVPTMLSVGSWECVHCGSRMSAHDEGGTLLFSLDLAIDSLQPNLWHFKHVAVLTSDGNLSILCASVRSVVDGSRHSGANDGICSLSTNHDSAHACGCDLAAGWYCDEHCDNGDHRAPAQVTR